MTREEAIGTLKEHKIMFQHDFGWDISTIKALDMAISALSENRGEPIYYPPCIDCNKKMDEIRRIYDKLKELPSVENKADFPQAKDIELTVKNFSKVLDNKVIRDATAEERCCFCGGVKRFGICQDCGSDM